MVLVVVSLVFQMMMMIVRFVRVCWIISFRLHSDVFSNAMFLKII